MDNSDEPQTLRSLWDKAEQSRLSLESSILPPNSPSYATAIASTIKQYATLASHIRSLALFSPNESLEDITTTSLPYLLADYYLASVQLREPSSPNARKSVITTAQAHYENFLSLVQSYRLLSATPLSAGAPSHEALYKLYVESPNTFSATGRGTDPSARRSAKVANFKAEKELKNKLAFLLRDPAYLEASAGAGAGDEEAVRKVYLAQIEMCVHECFQQLEGIAKEMEILAMAPDPTFLPPTSSFADLDARRRQGTAGGLGDKDSTSRLDQPLPDFSAANRAPLLSSSGKPLRPFTLVGSRQDIARGVFRPGHNLPTMSIDEYLDEERRRGNIIEGGGEASYARPEPDEDDMEKADAETMKAREWDEFKEDNPRGAGNTLNRG